MRVGTSATYAAESDTDRHGKRLTTRWLWRTALVVAAFWAAAVLLPQLLQLGGPWRAFGAGLVMPGAGLLYAIPSIHHPFGSSVVIGHVAFIVVEIVVLAMALRHFRRTIALLGAALCLALVTAAAVTAPAAVVIAGHVAGFLGVLVACVWAVAVRLIGRADSLTLVSIVVGSAAAGAGLTALHADMPGPMAAVPWISVSVMLIGVGAITVRTALQRPHHGRIAERRRQYLADRDARTASARASAVALERSAVSPEVTEATPEQVGLLRYLLSVASQPADDWGGFDAEGSGPLQQYRYQVNALGWAIATYHYSHAPAFAGVLTAAQVALVERAQHKAVWGYWYWQNLLGNWDLLKRRADPIDVPQNIMFTGYLNLQLGMFRQATGDTRYTTPGSIVFDWSRRQRFVYDHPTINAIAVRNFKQDLCLWPCEPVPSRGRTRGFVFPYCNAVTTAGIAVADALNGTIHAREIAERVSRMLDREFTSSMGDLVGFMVSGLGLSSGSMVSGPTVTAAVMAFLAPLCPDLAWRAWAVLQNEWLESGRYLTSGSAGAVMRDWGSNRKTNAESLAAAMLLADVCGEQQWRAELWDAACAQLTFAASSDNPGVYRFAEASVHANGMLAWAGFGRPGAFTDMATGPRPPEWDHGPRLADAPHPDVLVAKAVSDGQAVDVVLRPGGAGVRAQLNFDRLVPHRHYTVHGAVTPDIKADSDGRAAVTVEVASRTAIALRPV